MAINQPAQNPSSFSAEIAGGKHSKTRATTVKYTGNMIKSKGKAKIRVKTTKKSSKSLKAAAVKEAEQSSQSEAEEAAIEDEDAQEHVTEPFDDLPSDAELSAGENGEEEGRKGSMAAAMQRILHQSTSTKVCADGSNLCVVRCVLERFVTCVFWNLRFWGIREIRRRFWPSARRI